jgi:hypothetical protein
MFNMVKWLVVVDDDGRLRGLVARREIPQAAGGRSALTMPEKR